MNWKFNESPYNEKPKEASEKDFSKFMFHSGVREAIQNSIDARDSYLEPVKITFNHYHVYKDDIPGINELTKRIESVKTFWKDQANYFKHMKNLIETFNSSSPDKIPVLEIADFNTKGMTLKHNEDYRKSTYYSFSRGNNSAKDSEDTGGSEGEGKAAYFALSSLKSIYIHTVSSNGQIYEGLAKLGTHKYNGIHSGARGFYNSSENHLPQETSTIELPSIFKTRRTQMEKGTTIVIPGLRIENNFEVEIIKSIINNFWLAINENDLEVLVNETVICKKTLFELIAKFLPEIEESSRAKGNPEEYGRTLCYYETWNQFGEKSKSYTRKLKHIGEVVFRISKNPQYPGKVAYFRKQKMLIAKSSTGKLGKGYCGVFLCETKEGNKLLQKMEGKAHTEWDPKYWTEEKQLGKEIIDAINSFINECKNDFFSQFKRDEINIPIGNIGVLGNAEIDGNEASTKDLKKTRDTQNRSKRNEYLKHGFYINYIHSTKDERGEWKYRLSINLENIEIKGIEINVLGDNVNEKLDVVYVSDGYHFISNQILGKYKAGENILEFKLKSNLRHALKFTKIK